MKTKKITSIITILVLAAALLCPVSGYAEDIKVTINGEPVYFDQSPVMVDGRTLVPVRAIFEAMGCTVLWNGETQVVDIATDFGMMVLGVGSPYIAYRNESEDRSIVTDVPPQIINMRMMVPVRAIAECTGYNVDWDEAAQTVVITGEIKGITLPDADIAGYYPNSKAPDFGACFNMQPAKTENNAYTYEGVTGQQVIDYVETYLPSAGFLIDSEDEAFGMFIFVLSNSSASEKVRVSYSKPDKTLFVTLIK